MPQGQAAHAGQAALARNGSKQGRKSGVPPNSQQMINDRSQAAALRASHPDFPQSGSGYGGVGHGSNIAVHDATVAGIPNQNGTREHSHVGQMTPTGMTNSGAGIEGGRRVDGRGPVGGMINGEEHPAERKTFGQKLVNVLTCRCA